VFQLERSRHGVAGVTGSDNERRQADAIKFGKVQEADYTKARVRVLIGDEDDDEGHIVTGWLPMPGARARNDSDWHPLEVGERVAVLSESGDTPNGVVIPAGIFNTDFPAPGNKAGLWIRKFQDGGQITYDRETGEWLVEGMSKATTKVGTSTVVAEPDVVTVTVGGATITVKDGEITLSAGGSSLKLDGSGVNITGSAVKHAGVNIGKDHKHSGVTTGGGVTGVPQ
jgi:phage baseplate assembly protein V